MGNSPTGDGRPERRRAQRSALRLAATMRDDSGSEIPAQLIDVSTHGCRIECPSAVAADSWLWLDIAGLEALHCRIVWRCEEFAGLEFETPMTDAMLEKLRTGQAQLPETAIQELRDIAARTHGLARKADDTVIADLAELSRTCALDALVEGLRRSETGGGNSSEAPPAPPAAA
ncbi:MAG TPA: PilZ domain-containing protein [Sphingomicrobium sp.]|nr:PilZ domain-containing protein [Sphingomicrobium sp.]